MNATHDFKAFSEHFAVLALIFSIGLVGLMIFKSNAELQQLVVWAIIASYVLWGVVHHLLRNDLTSTIVLEYFLCGLLAGIIINSVLIQR